MAAGTRKISAILALLALTGCATVPTGPSVMVLPEAGKPFEVFQSEDTLCRSWAQQQIGIDAQEGYNQTALTGATVGTLIGAGIGALFGAASGHPGAGAAFGAGGGLLAGTAAGNENAQFYGYEAQRRYDNSYLQCMYAKGNQIPAATRARSSYRERREMAPPPPPPGREMTPPDFPAGPLPPR